MNSISRFTKRVKATMLVLTLDTRGLEAAGSAIATITLGGGIVAATMGIQSQTAATKANTNTVTGAGDTVANKTAAAVGANTNTTTATTDPFAAGQ